MRPIYKHTQIGGTILIALGVVALILIGVNFLNARHGFLLGVGVLAVCAVLFCSLTIQIDHGALIWSFGPGLISKRVALQEIASAEPVRNAWYNGWGIHYTRGGWLYNVSGFDGVEVTLKDGKKLRLGTDEPEALTAAIRSQITA